MLAKQNIKALRWAVVWRMRRVRSRAGYAIRFAGQPQSVRRNLSWPERALRVLMIFVAFLAIFFLALIPLSILYSNPVLVIGWFVGPVLVLFLPLLGFLYTGVRQHRPALYEILHPEEEDGITIKR